MKLWVVIVLAAAVGVSAGSGIAVWRNRSLPWDGTGEGAKAHALPAEAIAPPKRGTPQAVVDRTDYDFGVMDSGGTGSHDFVIANKGTGALKLTKGHTTCKCTIANLEQAEVSPGQSTKVHLEYRAKGFVGRYKQTATVITNDPKQHEIQLTVGGKIIPILRAVPEDMVFSSITAGDSATESVNLFDYTPKPMKIASHELVDQNTASLFDVKVQPLKPEVVAKELGAKSGVQVLVTAKPGLPVGTFKQTIRFKSDLAGAEQYSLDVRGNVVSDLAIVGGDWDDEHSLLTIGTVSSKDETLRKLYLIARGPFRDRVHLKIAERWPDLLQVELPKRDPPTGAGQRLREFPIKIRIAAGAPPADYLGTETAKVGRIVLETNHPRAPKVLIRVRFAVQN